MTEKSLLIELINKDEFPYKVQISSVVLVHLKEEYKKSKYFEIGGILFGRINRNKNIVTIEKLEVVRSKKKFRLAYVRNNRIAQKLINKVWVESEGIVNYIGEWHTHPSIAPIPSSTDQTTILEQTFEKRSNYFPYTLLLIIGQNEGMTLTISNTRRIIECIHIQ